jgi:hypothetical protein
MIAGITGKNMPVQPKIAQRSCFHPSEKYPETTILKISGNLDEVSLTFTHRPRGLDTQGMRLVAHAKPIHELPSYLPQVQSCMDIHGDPACQPEPVGRSGESAMSRCKARVAMDLGNAR